MRDGTVWSTGSNRWGQLGQDPSIRRTNTPVQVEGITDAVSVSAGDEFTIVLKRDGTVWAFGSGHDGALGHGIYQEVNSKPVQMLISQVQAVATGWAHTLLLKQDGTVWATGSNYHGQLGAELDPSKKLKECDWCTYAPIPVKDTLG